jgi:ABC-2 type transport system permease protein
MQDTMSNPEAASTAAVTLAPPAPFLPHALRALRALVVRELLKFSMQYGRLISALVRPVLWMVYDREMGLMRLLLTAPLPRPWLLFSKLTATAVLSLAQAIAFIATAWLLGTELPLTGINALHALVAMVGGALMLGALGLLLSVHIKQLENFAGTMNFVIFPMYFISTALYPLWKLQESGAQWVYYLASINPFTYAVEWIRFAFYGKDPGWAPVVVLVFTAICFLLACWGYDPQRGFGALTKRGGP